MASRTTETFLKACRRQRGDTPEPELRAETGAFLSRVRSEPELLKSTAPELHGLPPEGAAWLAVTFGSAIEAGADARLTGPAVWRLFADWLDRLPASGSPKPSTEQKRLLGALTWLAQSVVAHLARMPELRAELGSDEGLLERLSFLEGHSYATTWVREAITRASGRLLVLHATEGKGAELRYENIGNCFHLFSLIQDAVGAELPGGRTPAPEVGLAARHRSSAEVADHAWWHYGDPRSPSAAIGASIWGEASPRSIPDYDGVQVILLWPPLLGSRGWGSSFFGACLDALPADLVIERILPAPEVF
jgi:hypothetical protein